MSFSSITISSLKHIDSQTIWITNFDDKNKEYQEQIQKSVDTSDDIYSFAKGLSNPKQSLKTSLETEQVAGGVFHSKKAKTKNYTEIKNGGNGKVKIVRFREDPKVERLFAIKRPLNLKLPSDFNYCLGCYEKNLKVSLKLSDSPYFMKVHGIVIKEYKRKTKECQIDLKPYLILSHIDGLTLANVVPDLTFQQKLHILAQLKEALLQLFDAKIFSHDLYRQNVMITKDNGLKLIDYDSWDIIDHNDESAISSHCINLYTTAMDIASAMCNKVSINWPSHELDSKPSRESLEKALDNMIAAFRNAHSGWCTIL